MNKYTQRQPTSWRLPAIFGFSVFILLASSFASYYSNQRLIEAQGWVTHTYEVLGNADNLLSAVKDAERGQRGFIITNDSDMLRPYMGAYESATDAYSKLREQTVDNPTQQHNLDNLKILLDQRFTQMAKVLQRSNEASSQADRSKLFLDSQNEIIRGRQVMVDLHNLIDRVKLEEQRLLKARTDEQATYTRYTPIAVIVAAIISFLISIIAYLKIQGDLKARIAKQEKERKKYEETNGRIEILEEVTQRLAKGDFTARSMDEAKDELGRISSALNNMATALEKNFNELEERDWHQKGIMRLSDAVRSERFTREVSNRMLDSIATYLKTPTATLYIADNDLNLKLTGTYAATNAPEYIVARHGLTGQAVESRELMVSDALPASYLQIGSSLGSAAPAYVVVVPLLQRDIVVGVIELGLTRKPYPREIQFLQSNAPTMAISLNAAINYERMQELLEETQAQAEELQSQQHELENINSELEAQTEKLQASEEELKVQQEELQQANQELEERSRQLEERNFEILAKNTEVQRKAEELAQSTKYKSEFLANMSHELRTPLNSILLLSRLLSENGNANLNKDQVEYARVIQSSGNSLLSLIDEILDLSKIEAGKMELEYGNIAIREIMEDMRSIFEPLAKDKNVALNIHIAGDVPPQIETDKMRLEQVLKNLLSNAYKFTGKGNVTIEVANAASQPGYVTFTVADTGIGIPPDKQQIIFEAFQQADGSTRRKYGGTGLGLSISKQLTMLLGGDITVSSIAGKGSTFYVTIPASKHTAAAARKPETEQTTETARPRPVTIKAVTADEYIATTIPEKIPDDRNAITGKDKVILIVEDDTSFATGLLNFTRGKGYKGIVSVRGDEAIELANGFLPVGILLDLQLPVKSGWQVMEELKNNPRTRHIPVHIMSSYSVRKESMLKGAIDFINKPVDISRIQDIFAKLEHVLNKTSKKVLIVEDNPKHAKALAYFLETFAINTDIKTSVTESIDALKKDTDCVILDMGIPDNNAYRTLDEIKKTPSWENLPIIVFTGKSLSITEEHRIKQYADSIIVKTAHSYNRILDEVSLFLHLVEESKEQAAQDPLRKLGMLNDVLKEKTVLIVDDDVRNIFSLTKALEKVNMHIITATDGKEAVEKLKENKQIDIVLLDMMMPQMDGYETAARIRQNNAWKKLPVIAVTAKAMTGDREKCIQAGASDYITKPVDVDQLLSLLRVWLYEKQ